MSFGLSEEQYCYTGSNNSCLRACHNVGSQVVLYLLFALFIVVTILGNFVVILLIGCFKQLHNPTNVLIMSLALVDLLVGAVVMPSKTVWTIHGCWVYGGNFCQLRSNFDVLLTTLSIFHLICIAVDRHQAICNPLHYSRNITMPVAWIMVCVSWALASAFVCGLIYSETNITDAVDYVTSSNCFGSCIILRDQLLGILDSSMCFLFPCTAMICLYAKIFIVAKVHARKIGDMSKCPNNRVGGGVIKKSEHKATKTLSIVLSAFFFCWMPFFLNSMIGLRTPHVVSEILFWLGYLNSTMNPIIYALFYPCFKKCLYSAITLKHLPRT